MVRKSAVVENDLFEEEETEEVETRPAKAAKAAPAAPSKKLMRWDERLAAEAAETVEKEPPGGAGRKDWISFKGGVMALNDEDFPGDEVPVIILAHTNENVYYKHKYNPKKPEAPVCWAFNEIYEELSPEPDDVFEHQNAGGSCEDCEHNQWKKDPEDGKRRKACRQVRRLVVIVAGSFDENGKLVTDLGDIPSKDLAMVQVPITSGKFYKEFVKKVGEGLKRPPWGLVTRMWLERDKKDQFHINFDPVAKLKEEMMDDVMALREEALKIIDQPYEAVRERDDDDDDDDRKPAKRAARREEAPARAKRKY